MRPVLLTIALAVAATLTGCIERRLSVTSDPSGALVYINDLEVGRTPLEVSFLYHGTHDVRVELEGHEVLRTTADARAPLYEYPPIDLVAEALPVRFRNIQRWHFTLAPLDDHALPTEEFEARLAERARSMRDELAATPRPKASPLPPPGEGFEDRPSVADDDAPPPDEPTDDGFPPDDGP